MVAVGLNLRGPIVAVAPVLEDIQRELRIPEAAAGLLTTVPVLCFAVVSPLVAPLARRIGADTTVAVSVALLVVGIAVRPWGGYALMLAATILIGAAIAGTNVLLPAIARRDFADRPGPVLSAVTTSLLASATFSAFLTAPLALLLGWRAALALGAVLALAALVVWWRAADLAGERAAATGEATVAAGGLPTVPVGGTAAAARSVWRAPGAWMLGGFFGAQALLFYAVTAWLPTMLRARAGLDAAAAGTALSLFQLLGLAGAIAVPLLLGRGPSLRYAVAIGQAVLWVVMLVGLLVAPGGWLLWSVIGGLAQGCGISAGLTLIAMRSSSDEVARSVSGMVQTVGYCLAALGPVAVGALAAATSGWTVPVLALVAMSVLLGVLGVRSSVPGHIR